ncbi:MAG: hypothetical protein NZ578_12450 [Candidatus Binatia bacterium]|nr:hypothetical protein [Candidatus Binatia bacterium]
MQMLIPENENALAPVFRCPSDFLSAGKPCLSKEGFKLRFSIGIYPPIACPGDDFPQPIQCSGTGVRAFIGSDADGNPFGEPAADGRYVDYVFQHPGKYRYFQL